MQIPKLSPQLWSTFLLVSVVAGAGGMWFGYDIGSTKVQGKWDAEKATQANKATIQSEGIRGKEQIHAIDSGKVTDEIANAKQQFQADLAATQSVNDSRLRESEERANKYRAMSQASSVELERLAAYATGLDNAVSEGQRLVEEYRATLKQREREIVILSNQIKADRKLAGESDEPK